MANWWLCLHFTCQKVGDLGNSGTAKYTVAKDSFIPGPKDNQHQTVPTLPARAKHPSLVGLCRSQEMEWSQTELGLS